MSFLSGIINISFIFPGLSKIFLFIDAIIYALLEGAVRLTFTIGSLDFGGLTEELGFLIKNLNSLVGIFILFKLSLLFIQYLVEPDTFKDKAKGGEAVVKNVVVVLILLVLLNSGVLFGIFNDIQKVVFGKGDYEVLKVFGVTAPSEDTDMIQRIVFGGSLRDPAHTITVKIFEQFLFKYDGEYLSGDGFTAFPWDPNKASANVFDAEAIFGTVAASNYGMSFFYLLTVTNLFAAFSKVHYTAIISSAFGIYMIIKFMKMGMSLIIRFFKLFLMQIISPIAIVSYATPDGKKTFNNFWKTYFDIYMELFIRLFVAYVSIYLMGTFLNEISDYAGENDLITRLILSIMVLIGITKFMDEVPNLISSVFGMKIDNPKQKSALGILGGVLGGGIGLATGVGGAISAGATGWGAALSGGMGLFGGAKSGANSQNVGGFVSGQISNASKSSGRGFDIANAGGAGMYMKDSIAKTVGGKTAADKLKGELDYYKQSVSNLEDFEGAAAKRYLKEEMGIEGDKASYVSTQVADMQDAIENYNPEYTYTFGTGEINKETGKEIMRTYDKGDINALKLGMEQKKMALGDKFDIDVDIYRGKMMSEPEKMHPQLKQAYTNYVNYEKVSAAKEGREANLVTVKDDGTTTWRATKDAFKGKTVEAQQKHDERIYGNTHRGR